MARKKSESSAPEKLAAKKSARIKKREPGINLSDIPELTDAQLISMRRVGRPPLGEQVRQLIAIRIDPTILGSLQEEAKRLGKGYQTLINEILAEHVKAAS
jgi:uncharacterized protein (DUF4415 family)